MAFLTRLILALLGMVFAVFFAVAVLCWLALYVVFSSMRWLVTGQKPQVLMMWQQIQALRKGMQPEHGARWSGGSQASDGQWYEPQGRAQRSNSNLEVVEDAVVREIHDKHSLPKD